MATVVPPPGDRLQICLRCHRIKRGSGQLIKLDNVFNVAFHRHMCLAKRDALAELLCENKYIFVPDFDKKKPPPPAGQVLGKWALLGLGLFCFFMGAMVVKFVEGHGNHLLQCLKTMIGAVMISIGTVSGIAMDFARKVWDLSSENATTYVGVGLKNMILKFMVKVARRHGLVSYKVVRHLITHRPS